MQNLTHSSCRTLLTVHAEPYSQFMQNLTHSSCRTLLTVHAEPYSQFMQNLTHSSCRTLLTVHAEPYSQFMQNLTHSSCRTLLTVHAGPLHLHLPVVSNETGHFGSSLVGLSDQAGVDKYTHTIYCAQKSQSDNHRANAARSYLENLTWVRSLSRGFTPCRHRRSSSRRDHTVITYSVR